MKPIALVAWLAACGHPASSAPVPRNEVPMTHLPVDASIGDPYESDDVEPDADLGHATIGRVTKLEVLGTTSVVTIAAGNEDGVRRQFVARFVDDLDTPVGPECILIRIDKHESVCKVDQGPPATPRVLLKPR